MWKAPDRKKGEVSQSFNDGIVQICRTTDGGAAGYRPVPVLEERFTLRFAEQRLGINRLYQGRQNQVEIERVIRVPKAGGISTQDVAVIGGTQYRIDTVQAVPEVFPACLDLARVRIVQEYEVML